MNSVPPLRSVYHLPSLREHEPFQQLGRFNVPSLERQLHGSSVFEIGYRRIRFKQNEKNDDFGVRTITVSSSPETTAALSGTIPNNPLGSAPRPKRRRTAEIFPSCTAL